MVRNVPDPDSALADPQQMNAIYRAGLRSAERSATRFGGRGEAMQAWDRTETDPIEQARRRGGRNKLA